MTFLYGLCICIIILLIVCIRCLLVGVKDICLELAGIFNLVSDIRYELTKQNDMDERM